MIRQINSTRRYSSLKVWNVCLYTLLPTWSNVVQCRLQFHTNFVSLICWCYMALWVITIRPFAFQICVVVTWFSSCKILVVALLFEKSGMCLRLNPNHGTTFANEGSFENCIWYVVVLVPEIGINCYTLHIAVEFQSSSWLLNTCAHSMGKEEKKEISINFFLVLFIFSFEYYIFAFSLIFYVTTSPSLFFFYLSAGCKKVSKEP